MPLSLTPLPARLSGTSLEIRCVSADGPATLILESSCYLRLFDSPNTSGLLLGFVEPQGEPALHVFSARALAPSGSGQLVPAFQQFLQARQFNQTGAHAEILGYFSSALSSDAQLGPDEERFVAHIASRGVRFVVGRTADSAPHSLWLRFVNSSHTYLVTWEPNPHLEPVSDRPSVPETLAALSAATQLFAEPADLRISPSVAARNRRWTVPILLTFGLLLAAGGYLFYRNQTAPPATPVLTAATTGSAPPQPTETVAAPPATPIAAPAPIANTPELVPQQQAGAPAPLQAPPHASRQLDLSRLKPGSAPVSGTPAVELPAPSAIPPDSNPAPVLGPRGDLFRTAPPAAPTVAAPPEPVAPAPSSPAPAAAAPTPALFIPARLVKRTSISMAPSLVRTLPPNSQITIKVELDERGHPIGVSPVSATPGVAQYVSNLVAQAVRRWEYQPAMRGGKPIPGSTNVQVNITRSDQ